MDTISLILVGAHSSFPFGVRVKLGLILLHVGEILNFFFRRKVYLYIRGRWWVFELYLCLTIPYSGRVLDNGTSIQLSVNNVNSTRLPANGLLVAVDDITKICPASGNCATDASNVPLGNATENVAVVTVKSQTAGAKVTLSKVMFGYPTHRSGSVIHRGGSCNSISSTLSVTASIKSYNSSDSQIQYSQGWSQNGTYLSSNSQISDTFTFPFDGQVCISTFHDMCNDPDILFDVQAVWVWGFCGPRQMSTDYYGKWTINNRCKRTFAYPSFESES